MIFTPKESRKTCLGSKISLHSSPISCTRANGSQTVFWSSFCGILLCNCKWLGNLKREAMSSVVRCYFTLSKSDPLKKEKKLLHPDKQEEPYLLSSAVDNNNILVGLIPSISRVLLHLQRNKFNLKSKLTSY